MADIFSKKTKNIANDAQDGADIEVEEKTTEEETQKTFLEKERERIEKEIRQAERRSEEIKKKLLESRTKRRIMEEEIQSGQKTIEEIRKEEKEAEARKMFLLKEQETKEKEKKEREKQLRFKQEREEMLAQERKARLLEEEKEREKRAEEIKNALREAEEKKEKLAESAKKKLVEEEEEWKERRQNIFQEIKSEELLIEEAKRRLLEEEGKSKKVSGEIEQEERMLREKTEQLRLEKENQERIAEEIKMKLREEKEKEEKLIEAAELRLLEKEKERKEKIEKLFLEIKAEEELVEEIRKKLEVEKEKEAKMIEEIRKEERGLAEREKQLLEEEGAEEKIAEEIKVKLREEKEKEKQLIEEVQEEERLAQERKERIFSARKEQEIRAEEIKNKLREEKEKREKLIEEIKEEARFLEERKMKLREEKDKEEKFIERIKEEARLAEEREKELFDEEKGKPLFQPKIEKESMYKEEKEILEEEVSKEKMPEKVAQEEKIKEGELPSKAEEEKDKLKEKEKRKKITTKKTKPIQKLMEEKEKLDEEEKQEEITEPPSIKEKISLIGLGELSVDKTAAKVGKIEKKSREQIVLPRETFDGADAKAGDMNTLKDIMAPAALEINSNFLKIGELYSKTFFILSYPRYLSYGWLSPVINLDRLTDIAIFTHPVDTTIAVKNLRKKLGQIEAQIFEEQEQGKVRNPILETARDDIENLRDLLLQAQEKLFRIGVYITIYAENPGELKKTEEELSSILESRLIYIKPALFQQYEALESTFPFECDNLQIHTIFNTSPASTFFPFVSMDLTSENGILYGINQHNNSLVIFDRFSLENANMVIFAKSGAGKSYTAKLEILRSMMMGVECLIIDPENEYKYLAETVGGSFFPISISSEFHINPFDLPKSSPDESKEEILRSNILVLTGLIKLLLKDVTPEEENILDQAIMQTYASRDITPDADFSQVKPPLLEDLQTVLSSMEGGRSLAQRLFRYTQGTFANFLNRPTNLDINNRLVVFSLRDLEPELRPIAMYTILNFIWSLIRAELKKRIVLIDEAWILMRHKDSAEFLSGLAKRARKYFLGITTISQDVEDFIKSEQGFPIISNSSLQLLMRQSPASAEILAKTFSLTLNEKSFLLEAGVGEGLFFAGLKHVIIKVVSSYAEDKIVTSSPAEILERGKE